MANRKQIRALAKQQRANPKDIKHALQAEGLSATRLAVDGYTVAVAMVLWDKYAYSPDKLREVMSDISKLFEELTANLVSIEDCKQTLAEEANFTTD